jgi:hypothetical protein
MDNLIFQVVTAGIKLFLDDCHLLSILLETAPAISEILRTNGLHLARSHFCLPGVGRD